MSDLRPRKGIEIKIGGVHFHLLFTWAVIDQIQDQYHESLSTVLNKMGNVIDLYKIAPEILAILIEDEFYREGIEEKSPTALQLMHVLDISDTRYITGKILEAYGIDMPEVDDDDDEDDEEEEQEQINIARLLIIAKTQLGMSEEEFWETTPRKYFKLFDEYKYMKGIKTGAGGGGTIDDLP